jgi:hypothetical protein
MLTTGRGEVTSGESPPLSAQTRHPDQLKPRMTAMADKMKKKKKKKAAPKMEKKDDKK